MTKDETARLLAECFAQNQNNTFAVFGSSDRVWNAPQLAVAAGDDALFDFFKKDIGDFVATPKELFLQKYGDCDAKKLRVLSILFTHTETTLAENRAQTDMPALRWQYSRNSFNGFIGDFYDCIEAALKEKNIPYVIPDRAGIKVHFSAKYGKAANWSHRHSAYVAGHGTFGLCDGLITKWGKAVRFAGVIVQDEEITPDERAYQSPHEWCLFYKNKSCTACIQRCPANAITPQGHDKSRCGEYQALLKAKSLSLNSFVDSTDEIGCGLCQVKVPCEKGVPKGIFEK